MQRVVKVAAGVVKWSRTGMQWVVKVVVGVVKWVRTISAMGSQGCNG
jgi:hypothetical protein